MFNGNVFEAFPSELWKIFFSAAFNRRDIRKRKECCEIQSEKNLSQRSKDESKLRTISWLDR